jgi:enoyl-CoA hydratase/carnithine racemase
MIGYEVADGIAEIRFDRPAKLNALTLAMYEQLGQAWADARDDPAVRVVLLTGAGERAFCVGADLEESIPALADDRFDISAWDPAHLKGMAFYKPIVAAVNGLCLGGGFEILLATDLRIASTTASFGFPEPTIGFVPAGGTLVRLQRQIGYAPAMELLLTGERFSPEHLLRIGVLNAVVEPDRLYAVARERCERLAALSAQALQTIKQSVLELADLPADEAFAREAELGQRTFTSDDAREGLRSFAARRT